MSCQRLQDQHEELQSAAVDPGSCLFYSRSGRRYGITLLGSRSAAASFLGAAAPEFTRSRSNAYRIDYCPWSGRLLPAHLEDERETVCEQELGIVRENYYDDWPRELTNKEMWWIERGIDRPAQPEEAPNSWVPGEYRVRFFDLFGFYPRGGLWRSKEAPPHLCDTMESAFADCRVMITYIPWTREYGIRQVDPYRTIDLQSVRMRRIAYCPWCETELPKSLKAEWLGRTAGDGFDRSDRHLPPKYLSDTWWKELGL